MEVFLRAIIYGALDEAYESAENVPRLFMLLWVGGRCRGR